MHDKNGNILQPGDKAVICGTIDYIHGERELTFRPEVGNPFYVQGAAVQKVEPPAPVTSTPEPEPTPTPTPTPEPTPIVPVTPVVETETPAPELTPEFTPTAE